MRAKKKRPSQSVICSYIRSRKAPADIAVGSRNFGNLMQISVATWTQLEAMQVFKFLVRDSVTHAAKSTKAQAKKKQLHTARCLTNRTFPGLAHTSVSTLIGACLMKSTKAEIPRKRMCGLYNDMTISLQYWRADMNL